MRAIGIIAGLALGLWLGTRWGESRKILPPPTRTATPNESVAPTAAFASAGLFAAAASRTEAGLNENAPLKTLPGPVGERLRERNAAYIQSHFLAAGRTDETERRR